MNRTSWLLAFWCSLVLPVWARVGGGESYSGGGSSYSSGSSGGGGGGDGIGLIIELIIRLIFYYPKIGIPLVVGIAVWWWYHSSKGSKDAAFQDLQKWSANNTVKKHTRPDLTRLTAKDPNFSETLFLDFLTSLYTRALRGAGGSVGDLGAYLSTQMRGRFESAEGARTNMVIIGGLRILAVRDGSPTESVDVQFESNVALDNGAELFVVDVVTVQRNSGVQTRSPETVYALSCPSCGSNTDIRADGTCPACGQEVNDGRWSWVMTSLSRHSSTPKPPAVVSSGGEEIGTNLATVRSRDLGAKLSELRGRDPEFDDYKFKEFARSTFLQLQSAWTKLEWEKARPLETDYLFQQHQYWMHCYRTQGYRNVLEDVAVTRIEMAKISLDRFFDAITVRIFARMKDYTVDAQSGKVVSGSPKTERYFSEYWTFVRRAGLTSKDRDATRCPNCGGPLDRVTQVGDCQYCNTRITRGDFDWILSRIEQDEAYF